MVVSAAIQMFDMVENSNILQDKLHENVTYFVQKMQEAGFDIKPTQSAICAVMLYDANIAQKMSALLLEEGIYVVGFFFPVVPKNQARIRVQISAAHHFDELDKCVRAFVKVGREMSVLVNK